MNFVPTFPNAGAVTLVRRVRNGTDRDGNDQFTTARAEINGVPVWPLSSSEVLGSQDLSNSTLSALLPPGTDVTLIDAVEINGIRYEIDGDPNDYSVSPLTGNGAGVEVHLRREDG